MAAAFVLSAACNNSANEKMRTVTHDRSSMTVNKASQSPSGLQYAIGDHVPNELVCMVNDAFMNEEQILFL